MQYQERLSDREAVEHSAYDLRWAAVLHRPAGQRLCGRSTLVEFRARLALRDGVDRVFDRVLERARERGLLPTRPLRVLLDTRAMVGRGAVEDTYNLLARAMDLLLAVLARGADLCKEEWASRHGLELYVRRRDASLKGVAEVDWDDARARRRFLQQVVGDARRLQELAHAALPELAAKLQAEASEQMALLEQILRQDVEETPASVGSTGGVGGSGSSPPGSGAAGGSGRREATPATESNENSGPRGDAPARPTGDAEIREGTDRDRVASATDPDQRHGHKSQHRQFTGHKARIAVDAASQLIVDAEVLEIGRAHV